MLGRLVEDRVEGMWDLLVRSLGSEVPNREEDSKADQKHHYYDYYYFTEFALLGFQGLLGWSRCVHRYILKTKQ